jgi:NADH-quinone oxidoreductase subunit H
MFFLAEYSNMILMATLWTIIFLGGWLNPIYTIFKIKSFLILSNLLFLKVLFLLFFFVLIRAILPRYRFDQLMWVGWQAMFPILISFFIFLTGAHLFFENYFLFSSSLNYSEYFFSYYSKLKK